MKRRHAQGGFVASTVSIKDGWFIRWNGFGRPSGESRSKPHTQKRLSEASPPPILFFRRRHTGQLQGAISLRSFTPHGFCKRDEQGHPLRALPEYEQESRRDDDSDLGLPSKGCVGYQQCFHRLVEVLKESLHTKFDPTPSMVLVIRAVLWARDRIGAQAVPKNV